ncbi:MAG TPA: tetratricopeptide repeat protein [Bryobacteraceae bacterium]|nr:tetratricopeptide repeat protein [Bryobacteraceae bacterium]
MKQILSVAAACLLILSPLKAAENLQLGSNESLFAVLAAANAAGYDEGVALPDNNPLRAQLREYLQKQNIAVLPDLKAFYRKHMQRNGVQDLSQYISYALSVNGPPDFAWRTRDVDVPPDAMALAGFTPLLIDFYRQANVEELWKRSQPAYEKEMEKYHSSLLATTTAVDAYLRVPAGGYLGRRFQVFIDLLAAPEQVQTRNYGDDAFVIVTASEKPRVFDIRHAYLHFEVDPIVIKFGVALDQKRSLIDFAQQAPLEPGYKSDFVLLANESVIKAVESRLDKNKAEADQAARQGYILTPYFAEELPVFEKQEQGLRYYFEDMVSAIDLSRESSRIAGIRFDAAPLVRAGRQVSVATPEPKLSASGQTLENAEDLYRKRNLDEAKDLYLKSLEQTGSAEEHAQAWYGLARISVLKNDPAAAVKLFEKTLGASPDDQTKAWTLVYLARLSTAGADPERAAKFYQEALGVKGASEAARKAAQTESKNIPK